MNRETIIREFPVLLPLAAQWAAEQEAMILTGGVPLKAEELEDASQLGVREPGKVRLLKVPGIPRPADPRLTAACDAVGFLTPATRGLTVGYGIFVRQDCWGGRELIRHELVHTAQYERFGSIESFLRCYLTECLTFGYDNSPLEIEAQESSARLG